tara:strand:- start:984 stop:1505 length:522 start_codon:yes stop_codon:yes gene_type:complete
MGRIYFNKDFYLEDPSRKDTKEGSVFVIGPEASGTKWIANIIQHHPDIHCVHHFSYPSGKKKYWTDLWKFDSLGLSSVIIVCRDLTITKLSQERMGYIKETDKSIKQAKSYIQEQLSTWKGKFALLSYESMLQWPSLQLSQIFRLLDYDINSFDYNIIDPIDGNKKYIETESE